MQKSRIFVTCIFFAVACGPEGGRDASSPLDAAVKPASSVTVPRDSGSSGTVTSTTSPLVADASVMRHLPGTAITTATGKYIYLVQSDATIAPFASAEVAKASGYPLTMIVTVSVEELRCYGRANTIAVALPTPGNGKLRDGTLVKEKGKTDTYAVSDGVAWPIRTGKVFEASGYDWENLTEIAAGSLARSVEAVGNCASGMACLDEEYIASCARDEIVEPISVETGVTTSTATSASTSTAATSVATSTATASSTGIANTVSPTAVATSTATTTVTQTTGTGVTTSTGHASTGTVTALTTTTKTVVAAATATATASSIAAACETPRSCIDLSWVWSGDGADLCLNALYFAGANKAVLLIWLGPGADHDKGAVATQTDDRFCWSFSGKEKGLYYFWADVPASSCTGGVCPRDAVSDNGAMYMTAPKATAVAKTWLHCEATGCDGAAYWDGVSFTPMGD